MTRRVQTPVQTGVAVNVRLDDPDALALQVYPALGGRAFVAVELGRSVAVLVDDIAVVEALAVQIARARDELLSLQSVRSLPPSASAPPVAASLSGSRAAGDRGPAGAVVSLVAS